MKRQLLLAALFVAGALGMRAQTDVTDTYITNADFETNVRFSTSSTYTNFTTKGNSENSTQLAGNKDITGWTNETDDANTCAATFAYGTSTKLNNSSIPSTGYSSSDAAALGISVGWGCTTLYKSASEITLPAGFYTITYHAYNINTSTNTYFKSLVGFYPTSGTATTSSKTSFTSSQWVTDEISFTLEEATAGYIKFGGTAKSGSGSGGSAKLLIDGITLNYTAFITPTTLELNASTLEIMESNTETLTATITPSDANYQTNITWSSSDASVATVSSSGVVTAVSTGTATITATTANSVTATCNVTVVAPANDPESITLTVDGTSVSEILLDGNDLTATLTAAVSPSDASQAVTYTSSDESVAIVSEDGTITGVGTGTATITATSSALNTVTATVDVTVYMFANGSFEYSASGTKLTAAQAANNGALTMYGWTQADPGSSFNNTQIYNSSTSNSSAFGTTVTPTDGSYYLFFRQGWNSSSTDDRTFTSSSVKLPVGKYTISYNYMLAESYNSDHTSTGTTLTLSALNGSDETLASATVSAAANPGSSYFTTSSNWATSSFTLVLTAETTVSFKLAMTPRGGIRSDMCVDNFIIEYENIKEVLSGLIASVTIPTANVGSSAFQIPSSAVNTLQEAVNAAQAVYDDATATDAQAVSAIEALETAVETFEATELNDPNTSTKYYIKVATTGHDKEGNAVVASLGSTSNNNPTGYSFNASAAPADYLAQAWTFTKVSGNNYKISITMPAGEVYLTNGTNNSSTADGADSQIQGTLDADKAMAFTIASSGVDGKYNIYNTNTNSTIACQSGGALYTESGNADFAFAEASPATVEVAVGAGKYATRIFPFTPTLGSDIKAYTCSAVDGTTLTLAEATEPTANTPYILENTGSADYSESLSAYGTASTTSYTNGLLTGTLVSSGTVPTSDASNNYYVLQTQNEKQAFYIVKDETINLVANRAYLTVPASTEVKAFFFGNDEADAINGVSMDAGANVTLEGIYSVNGVRQNSLQKGVNILRMSDGTTRKVIVK